MQQLRGRVAVVTGAASGIGLGLAERFADEGMRLVLADVEEGALGGVAERLRAGGAEVVSVICDVSRQDDVARLASRTLEAFGAVHLVCNNAGVADTSGAAVWEGSLADWEWVIGVNLWGVIYGMRAFVPLLLQQAEGHVVNTASVAGLTPARLGSYSVTKHAVVALSEALHGELAAIGAPVGVSVLCPGLVRTRILEADRNRPAGAAPRGVADPNPAARQVLDGLRERIPSGTPPSEIAACVVDAIRANRLYVLPHPAAIIQVRQRMDDIERGSPLPAA
jgi:NAD(P)-dependent dehydrogenase (short-subunit alcohol dehydrogenase family)